MIWKEKLEPKKSLPPFPLSTKSNLPGAIAAINRLGGAIPLAREPSPTHKVAAASRRFSTAAQSK
jgi:hypothetical protein